MSGHDGDSRTYDVLVVGCGLMGAALARTLATAGYAVAAWNRTPERAAALASDGVTPVRSLDAAVQASRLVIVCTNTYDSARAALAGVTDWQGTDLVNLVSGTPDEATEMVRWAEGVGVPYLDGCIGCYPREVGTPDGMVAVAGPADVWARHERTLLALGGGSHHISEEVRAAKVVAAGLLGAFAVAGLGAYVEAVTYVLSQGVSAAELRPTARRMVSFLDQVVDETAQSIAIGEFDTDQATLEIFAEGARSALTSLRTAGHHARVLGAAADNLGAAEAAGLGKLGVGAQSKVLTTDPAERAAAM